MALKPIPLSIIDENWCQIVIKFKIFFESLKRILCFVSKLGLMHVTFSMSRCMCHAACVILPDTKQEKAFVDMEFDGTSQFDERIFDVRPSHCVISSVFFQLCS